MKTLSREKKRGLGVKPKKYVAAQTLQTVEERRKHRLTIFTFLGEGTVSVLKTSLVLWPSN